MSFCAIIPVANLAAANATLAGTVQNPTGFGPNNFSVPSYSTGANPSFASLHLWDNPAFETAVKAIPNVTWEQSEGDPVARTQALMTSKGSKWGNNAPLLTGTVSPGLYKDSAGKLWWVIQSYNTATYPDPTVIPALIRPARVPGQVSEWIQPLDQYDAYLLVNPFTAKPDQVTHNGNTWKVTQADGSGNNIWEPGVYGWTQI